MNKTLSDAQAIGLLEQTLDTFGGDLGRWPAETRATLSHVIAQNADAQRRLADAQAFDRLLDVAPRFDAQRHAALASAIVSRAERQLRMASERAEPAFPKAMAAPRRNAYVAAALAASLVLGVMSGQNATVNSIAAQILNGDTQTGSGQQYALGDDADALLDEDLL